MSIPDAIRNIPRPSNTVVYDTQRESTLRYAVREVSRAIDKNGKSISVPGKIVGHIHNNEFHPKIMKAVERYPVTYGNIIMAYEEAKEIFDELKQCFPYIDACTILVLAILRVVYPGAKQKTLSTFYNNSFISSVFPNIPISKNSVSKFIYSLGKQEIAIRDFFNIRISKVVDSDLVLIDTTHKDNTSKINNMSQFSYKSIKTGIPGISVLYAYDADKEEPICARAYPGNFIDVISCKNFINSYKLEKGIIVADKGFTEGTIRELTSDKNDLHYISPLRRNSKLISDNNMLDFDNKLTGFDTEILCKKKAISKKIYLYSFCDIERSSKELKTFVRNQVVNEFDEEKFRKKSPSFGTIVFSSDLDLDPYNIYKAYKQRWQIELMFKQFKHDLSFNTTNVQTEISIHGSEFINFISTVISNRLTKTFKNLGWLNDKDYGEVMGCLAQISRYNNAPTTVKPDINDKYWGATRDIRHMLVEAGICTDLLAEPSRKPGRPASKSNINDTTTIRKRGRPKKITMENTACEVDLPKRKPGRPKSEKTLKREALEAEMLARGEVPVKRGPGRPKGSKNKATLERERREAEMRANGELPEKRKRGRPRKDALGKAASEANMPKRKPGRPKSEKTLKREALEAEMLARGEVPVKRGPGRPKGSRSKATLEREAHEVRADTN